ncbi:MULTISPECIES: molybdopterin molybdotransferase MoeA [Synechocystis]|uniref:Molybdopterin molybdenumtransferase n=1 Tax=Synechocystis salina LEGE 00031 TaxID=1828736 RepID=A0ABR9VRI5_9SYNC|nr:MULTISPECIES: molybdopterin molybdotransferase MoeA [Synechocystis]MBE9194632.1 molybdopterin molybdotransferase MoeA [Synechocystis sp. LEGE 06083]MBE9240285.1 molybdopterin molybdotransferase MoeA [Synechocystis salina LEGE 00041]MBE9253518.1 molybdopterin molybdotransferase MoeA [Synechocystis salina LEGE 00031]
MISVAAAVEIIQTHWPDFGDTTIDFDGSYGAVLAESIEADRDYPPGDRVMMDGIALAWSEYNQGRRQFNLLGTVAAGDRRCSLPDQAGCLEVMTGALLPQNCDLVIPYEEVAIADHQVKIVDLRSRNPGEFIHSKASDCRSGTVILESASKLNGPAWSIITSFGKTKVKIKQTPRIQIISTGDELVEVTQKPESHQLRRSNLYGLQVSLQSRGFQNLNLNHLADDQEVIISHYQRAKLEYDILIYSGGISKGKFDYLPKVWSELGVTKYIHGVAQKPGKPMYFGVDHQAKTVIIGLPGNPISSLVCLHRYFLDNPPIYAQLTRDFTFKKDLTYFLPVKRSYTPQAVITAEPLPVKNSGEFIALANSDGFLELPQHQAYFQAGECFPFYAW